MGPVVETKLRMVVYEWHAPNPECLRCGGSGIDDYEIQVQQQCECTGATQRDPTSEEIRAWLRDNVPV